MSLLITGSLAYDHIMVFKDRFKNHILPEKTHVLSVSFQVDELSRNFGGTAGNVAYNLALLGEKPIIVGVAGKDFQDYSQRLSSLGLSTQYIRIFPDEFTAQAFITTDLDDNQIAAFHLGAMRHAHEQPLSVIREPIDLVLIGPNQVKAILQYTDHCRVNKIPFWLDPGQALTELSGPELVDALIGADGMVVNDYEWDMVLSKSKLSSSEILGRVKTVLVTLGEKGVDILSVESQKQHISAVPNIKVIDPTGAGDAFRAGLLFGLRKRLCIEKCCQYACAVASFAVEKSGTQNHRFQDSDLVMRKNLYL
jgi:adenosine kinase